MLLYCFMGRVSQREKKPQNPRRLACRGRHTRPARLIAEPARLCDRWGSRRWKVLIMATRQDDIDPAPMVFLAVFVARVDEQSAIARETGLCLAGHDGGR